MTHLHALYDAVKDGTADALPYETWLFVCGMPDDADKARLASMGDTQAAIDFVQAVLPEYAWSIDRMGQAIVWDAGVEGDAISSDAIVPCEPARALLLAALAAMIAKGER